MLFTPFGINLIPGNIVNNIIAGGGYGYVVTDGGSLGVKNGSTLVTIGGHGQSPQLMEK
jgi:hypothetical protein